MGLSQSTLTQITKPFNCLSHCKVSCDSPCCQPLCGENNHCCFVIQVLMNISATVMQILVTLLQKKLKLIKVIILLVIFIRNLSHCNPRGMMDLGCNAPPPCKIGMQVLNHSGRRLGSTFVWNLVQERRGRRAEGRHLLAETGGVHLRALAQWWYPYRGNGIRRSGGRTKSRSACDP